MMNFSGAMNYSYAYAKIRARKSKMLTVGDYEQLLSANSLEDALRILSASYYEPLTSMVLGIEDKSKIPYMFERYLFQFIIEYLKPILQSLPKKVQTFLNYYLNRYYISSVKTIIRAIIHKIDIDDVQTYLIAFSENEYQELLSLLEVENLQILPERISNRIVSKLLSKVLQDVPENEIRDNYLFFEQELDKAFFTWLWKTAHDLFKGSPELKHIKQFLGTEIDLLNISFIARAKYLKIPNERIKTKIIPIFFKLQSKIDTLISTTNLIEFFNVLADTHYSEIAVRAREKIEQIFSVSTIDKMIEEYFLAISNTLIIGGAFHVGLIFYYLTLLLNEAKNVRVIIQGKWRQLSPDIIREYINII